MCDCALLQELRFTVCTRDIESPIKTICATFAESHECVFFAFWFCGVQSTATHALFTVVDILFGRTSTRQDLKLNPGASRTSQLYTARAHWSFRPPLTRALRTSYERGLARAELPPSAQVEESKLDNCNTQHLKYAQVRTPSRTRSRTSRETNRLKRSSTIGHARAKTRPYRSRTQTALSWDNDDDDDCKLVLLISGAWKTVCRLVLPVCRSARELQKVGGEVHFPGRNQPGLEWVERRDATCNDGTKKRGFN